MLTDALDFDCPWCGETNQVEAEPGDVGQWVIQDCQVCCSPIEIRLPGPGRDEFMVRREGN